MKRRDENHGLSGCVGSPYCADCGGVCSTDSGDDTPVRRVKPERQRCWWRDGLPPRSCQEWATQQVVGDAGWFCDVHAAEAKKIMERTE